MSPETAEWPTVPVIIQPDPDLLDSAREYATEHDCAVAEAIQDLSQFEVRIEPSSDGTESA